LRLQPDALPEWAMPVIGILGSRMHNLASVAVKASSICWANFLSLASPFAGLVVLLPFPLAFLQPVYIG
jgi:hypothetical protein